MDLSQVEQGTDGLYSLCVHTKDFVLEDQVREVFSKFGHVERVHFVKDGLIFVRFNEQEDAVNCLNSMRNDVKYNVKPPSNKKRNNSGFDSSTGNSDMNRRGGGGFDSNRGGDQRRTGGGFDSNRGGGRHMNGRLEESRRRGGGDNNHGLPPKPPLVPLPLAPRSGEKVPHILSKTIVIGNLPVNSKQIDVVDLCVKAGIMPLHVAMKFIKRPPYRKIEYAIVYVKTDEEVDKLKIGLDELEYQGCVLFVDTMKKLSEDGRQIKRNFR